MTLLWDLFVILPQHETCWLSDSSSGFYNCPLLVLLLGTSKELRLSPNVLWNKQYSKPYEGDLKVVSKQD
jgi:hypothetical protein